MTANERLQDLEIRHAAYLERFTQGEINSIKMALQDAVLKLSEDLPPNPERLTARQLQALIKKSERLIGTVTKEVEKLIEGSIEAQIQLDTDKAVIHLSDQLPDEIAGKLKIASPAQVRELINYTPASKGSLMSTLVSKWEADTVERFSAAIRLGVLEGDTLNDLTRRIRGEVVQRKSSKRPGEYIGGVLETTTKGAQTLARTAVSHVNNRAREAFYKENEDIIKGYQFVATLDSVTCPVCGSLDGQVFGIDEPKPPVPEHYNCRCLYVPVLKTWKEMGLEGDELPPGMRSSLDGAVPATMTYQEWLAKQSKQTQDDIMGIKRAHMFRSGLALTDMVDRGKVLTLKELGEKIDD